MTETKSNTTNLVIQIGIDILEAMKINRLSVEDLFILLAIDEDKVDVLNSYDSNNTDERVMFRYQNLHRRGFLELSKKEDGAIYFLTDKSKEFLYSVRLDYETLEVHKVIPREAKPVIKNPSSGSKLTLDEQFDILWKSYPPNSKNDKFLISRTQYRVLRDSSIKARESFKKVIAEGKYNLDDMLVALEHEVKVRKSNTRQNDLDFMPAITAWLNQQKFVGWLEEAKNNTDKDVEENPFETNV